MPELPDVEIFKNYMDATSLHQKIKDISVENSKVLDSISPQKLNKVLKNHSFESTVRHGKYLFAKTGDNACLVLHFGMTGSLKYFKNQEQANEYIRVLFTFTNGYYLGYISQRMLGRVGVTESVEKYIEKQKLGPDALNIKYDDFKGIFNRSRGAVKTTLMNQNLIAGIGNIYADEILFHSKIHPNTPVGKLDGKVTERLFHNIRKILNKAVKYHANPAEFPDSYFLPHRNEGQSCPVCGARIKTMKISGRTAYFCPTCQKQA